MRASASIRIPMLACLFAFSAVAAGCTENAKAPDPGDETSRPASTIDPDKLPKLASRSHGVPTEREGDQLPAAELDELIADAEAARAADDGARARTLLQRCANRIPASARCDGLYGMEILQYRKRRNEAIYYMGVAARTDDAKASAEFYDELAEALKKIGHHADAVDALELANARETTTARQLELARVLSNIPERRTEGADAIARVREAEDSNDLLFEEAVLRAQTPGHYQRAIDLFREYGKRTKDSGDAKLPPAELALRVDELVKLVEAGKDVAAEPAPAAESPEASTAAGGTE